MRDLTKSVMDSMIELGLRGAQQMLSPFVPTRELNATVDATRAAALTMERGVTDFVFGLFNL